MRLHCSSQPSQESSLENILTLPSLPNRMTFLLKIAMPLTRSLPMMEPP